MPKPPSERRLLPEVLDDLESIQRHNPDHADRILLTINDWQEKIAWGRVPQDHLTYFSGSAADSFYRERVGNRGYRTIHEISGDVMTAVAVLPKSDSTDDLQGFRRRLDRS